jgi:hypothetical protein
MQELVAGVPVTGANVHPVLNGFVGPVSTVPVGTVAPDARVSVTVIVQLAGALYATDAGHEMVTVTGWRTVTVVAGLVLVACVESPG